jgi:hypothetical protein
MHNFVDDLVGIGSDVEISTSDKKGILLAVVNAFRDSDLLLDQLVVDCLWISGRPVGIEQSKPISEKSMTAEIAIMNKMAIALAADSAATISGGLKEEKIFDSADKLFELSNRNPIGVMIYSGPSFMQVPLPALIRQFRGQCCAVKKVEDRHGRSPISTETPHALPGNYQ